MEQELTTYNEQLMLQHDIEEALKRAEKHEATKDDISLLAWAAGVKKREAQ